MSESDWAVVRIVGTEEEAALIAGFLRSRDVAVEVESLLFHQEPVNFGRLGEVRVRVPQDREAEALQLLDELDEAELDDDGGDYDDYGADGSEAEDDPAEG